VENCRRAYVFNSEVYQHAWIPDDMAGSGLAAANLYDLLGAIDYFYYTKHTE
jgi:hypothetical protein